VAKGEARVSKADKKAGEKTASKAATPKASPPKQARAVARNAAVKNENVKTAGGKLARRTVAISEGEPGIKSEGKTKMSTAPQGGEKRRLSKSERDHFRMLLIAMKEHLTGQVASLKGDSLKREDGVNSAEDGTDAFERQFALTIASAENHDLVEIDEALQRLEEGFYGVCEECTNLIEMPRLKALPFVRKCVQCQSKTENGRSKSRSAALLEGM
jgi:DnaK suppressor protein